MHIILAVEDDLSEAVLRRILEERPRRYIIDAVYKRGGFGFIKKQCGAFNGLAAEKPVLLLTDLDKHPCAPALMEDWLQTPRNPGFLFRVAVREVEAWLLADAASLGKYLAVRSKKPFPNPEGLDDPKRELLQFAERSTRRNIRENITRRDSNGVLQQGPAYNLELAGYVNAEWPLAVAILKCPSLGRMVKALAKFE